MANTCPISAVFPLYERIEAALKTLAAIKSCDPAPAEILVCLDNDDKEMAKTITDQHPEVRLLINEENLGPGGSRNRLFAAARNELIANFDDDSFPADPSFFSRACESAARFPHAAVISAASQPSEWMNGSYQQIAIASGCGCVFRKSWFEKTTGYVPLPIAYSMEEVDVGLQLHALGGKVIHDPQLRVVHDHGPIEMVDARMNATVLANTALFPYLRFPMWLWPVGVWQVLRRIGYLLRHQWTQGLLTGLQMIPDHLRTYATYRKSLRGASVLSWLYLRYRPITLESATSVAEAE